MGYKTYTCPISRDCGGCEWLAVPYPIQLRRKQEQEKKSKRAARSSDEEAAARNASSRMTGRGAS